jgi:alkylhydroperoxidase family enzyme
MRQAALAVVLSVLGASASAQQPRRLEAPRIPPAMNGVWQGHTSNDVRTFVQHPDLLNNVMPLIAYVSNDSALPPRHRELLLLRAAWLCRSEYVWSQRVGVAREKGLLSVEDVQRVAAGPEVPGWSPFEAALLTAADELFVNSFVTTATWNRLAAEYSRPQLMDIVFAVGTSMLWSTSMNTFGTAPDRPVASLPSRTGSGLSIPVLKHQDVVLPQPRILPMEPSEWTPEVRAILDPANSGRAVGAIFRTYAQHPKSYVPRQLVSDYIRGDKLTIPERTKEMLILRIAWLGHSAYQWSTHEQAARRLEMSDREILGLTEGPDSPVWDPFDAAIVRAVDEMNRDAFISDATWNTLSARYDDKQMMDVVITTTYYRMVAMAMITFGVPLDAGAKGFPQ